MNQFNQSIQNGLDIVAKNEGFLNYTIDIEKSKNHGFGLLGEIIRVTINGIRHQINVLPNVSTNDRLNLIVKIPSSNQIHRELIGFKAFKREVYMYNEVLPVFVKFQEDKGITRLTKSLAEKIEIGFFSFPKCYLAHYNEKNEDDIFIIMEDLCQHNFQMENKHDCVGYQQIKILYENLARFHAISFAMKDQCPAEFNKFKNVTDIYCDLLYQKNFMEDTNKLNIDQAMASLKDCEDKFVIQKFIEFIEKLKSLSYDCTNSISAEPYTVINHGDCWIHNMMFNYDENNAPKSICLLDWQLSRYVSPVLDLVFFMFACTDQLFRDKHFNELIGIYHKILCETINSLGSDAEKLFPYESLEKQLKLFGKFGLVMAITILPMLCTENKDLPDINEMAESLSTTPSSIMDDSKILFKLSSDAKLKYNKRIKEVIQDSVNMGFI